MKLKDICDVRDGTHDSPKYISTGYPLITSKNIINGKLDFSKINYISEKDFDQINKRSKVDEGDIIMPMIGTIGNPYLVETNPNYAIKNVALIKFPNNCIKNKFVYYYFKSTSFKKSIMSINRGGTQKFISLKDIRELEIPYYNLDIQNKIIKRLEKINKIVLKRKQEIDLLDELIKSRFVEMFGDPILNDKNWKMGKIVDIGNCVAGATPSTKLNEYWDNGTISWMSSGEINKERIYKTNTKITQLGYEKSSTKIVPSNTVVIAMAGQGSTRGKVAITEIELCTNQSICSIVSNDKMNPEYLLQYLKMHYQKLRNSSTNSDGRGGLNLKIISNYPIVIPPIEFQNQFADFVEQVNKSKFIVDLIRILMEMVDSNCFPN